MRAPSPQTHDVATVAHALADAHGAATLAAALVVRLRADGRGELAAAVAAALSGDDVATINPNPPDPHRGEASK